MLTTHACLHVKMRNNSKEFCLKLSKIMIMIIIRQLNIEQVVPQDERNPSYEILLKKHEY